MAKRTRKPSESAAAGVSAQADELAEYRKKRDPTRTNEPFAAERKRSASETRTGRFVVHLHDARRRHYDLRVQVGGTLKSFAVPRGPSLDPAEKRLAVNTEDHPLEYLDFEDVIPEGSYGAGAMIAWDIGVVSYLEASAERGIENGKIDLWLKGEKLCGRFALVHTKRGEGNEWLLLKKQDAHSRSGGEIVEELPRSVLSGLTVEELLERERIAREIEATARELGARERELDVTHTEPMLCALSGAELDDPERIYELKLDGVRIVADKHGKLVTLRYRNGGACTASYPEIARAVETLPGKRLVLDGEIVVFDEGGRPRFERILPRIQARRPRDVARVAAEAKVAYLVFDLLAIGGADLTELPLLVRKRLLGELVRGRGFVRVLDHIDGRGTELFALCRQEGLEGVVAKRKHTPYRFGPRRSEDWVKLKCERDDDFVIVGWVSGKGSRAELGALCVATYGDDDQLVYRGRVGSGFDDKTLDVVTRALHSLEQATPTLPRPIPEEATNARWVRPELVASIRYLGFTEEERLRAAVFRGLRPDVEPKSCRARPHDALAVPEVPTAPSAGESASVETRPGLTFSNRNKIFWPNEGFTKGDLLDYYTAVADVLLPFLRNRPVVLVRHPDGIHGKSFFQWNVPRGTPDWIRQLTLRDPEDPAEQKHVFLVDDVESLLYIVNLGCIPFHVLACREQSVEFCDFLTIDFDLGEQPFGRAVELALALRAILEDAGLSGYPKTSGQGGLHVLVPLGPNVPFAAAKLLVELLGRLVCAGHEQFSTVERRVDRRGGRLYIDTGQTGQSRTIVAPYSVRAYPGATISTPLFWEEVSGALDPRRFNIVTLRERLVEVGDPLRGLLDARPDIPGALAKLERWIRK